MAGIVILIICDGFKSPNEVLPHITNAAIVTASPVKNIINPHKTPFSVVIILIVSIDLVVGI